MTTVNCPELKQRGFNTVRGFFDDGEVVADLRKHGREVVRLREETNHTLNSPDTMGLPYKWLEHLVEHPKLVEAAMGVLGPGIVCSGWRVIADNKPWQTEINAGQDWADATGETDQLTVFLPLTPVSPGNGGLIFVEGSHLYGPASQGHIDLTRSPPMREEDMDAEPGDVVFCDFRTSRYFNSPRNDSDCVIIQIDYRAANGDKKLYNQVVAVSAPPMELRRTSAQRAFNGGDFYRATHYAMGILADDPDNVGAALLLYDLLWQEKNPEALSYLEKARRALERFQARIDVCDAELGVVPRRSTSRTAPALAAVGRWKPVAVGWYSHIAEHPVDATATGTLATPGRAWDYGASGHLMTTDEPAIIRISARALAGKVGIALLTEDYSNLASEEDVITPEDGDASVLIAFRPENSPARLLVRNHGDEGVAGEVKINGVWMTTAGEEVAEESARDQAAAVQLIG